MKPHVVYWNNIPSPYMVQRFNAIARRGRLHIEAWFDARTESDRSWTVDESAWLFDHHYLPPSPGRRLLAIGKRLILDKPDLMVTLHGSGSFTAGTIMARARGVPVALHAMKTFETWNPRRRYRELAKKALFPHIAAFQVTGPDAARYVEGYGARPERIFAFPEPVDVAHFAAGSEAARATREAGRDELGLQGCVFVYVGRIWRKKGLDYLVDAYRRVRQETKTSLLLIGDGQDEDYYKAVLRGLPDVHFAGFVQARELPGWYALSDVMVFPTLGDPYGHVVQEAMACSLPVIASSNAGDIAGRVEDGESGFIVPAASSDALYLRMSQLASDSDRRRRMGHRGLEIIAPRTVEWWAEQFEDMVLGLVPAGEPDGKLSQVEPESSENIRLRKGAA